MAYVKEQTDLDLLRELNKQTEYNLLAGKSWVIDKETGSYLSKLGQPIGSPDDTEVRIEYFQFYHSGISYDLTTAYGHHIEGNLYEIKIIDSDHPAHDFTEDLLALLSELYAIAHNYGDYMCDTKLNDNKFVLSLQF
ncbi:TPA: hypothetical protein G8W20_004829 [Salmonella enterica]|uniref:Uncharacterized protein n=1 Tax=Salmonella enterica TaxID=28901 RepID=A0A758JRM4_SALER|nr:hypothetical protein [Klebsiella oxytoca]HAG1192599.1 hypothetical protein [Salmonella enterica]